MDFFKSAVQTLAAAAKQANQPSNQGQGGYQTRDANSGAQQQGSGESFRLPKHILDIIDKYVDSKLLKHAIIPHA